MKIKYVAISKILKEPSLYCAHEKDIAGGEKYLETLEEHTMLCQQYFTCIYEKKCIGESISRFFQLYMAECSRNARELAEEMWCNVVTFHDMGKHNPNFQRDVLGRKEVERNRVYNQAGSGHSALSAVMYMDYYLSLIHI